MSSPTPEAPGTTALESLALQLVEIPDAEPGDETTLNRREMVAQMRPIERGVVIRGAVAGALSGLVASVGVLIAAPLFAEWAGARWFDNLSYYGVTLGIAILATIIEVAYLYYDGMRSALRLGVISGAFRGHSGAHTETLKRTLVRAGLEVPCSTSPRHGIDPMARQNRGAALLYALIYKLKVTATSFALKVLLRRFLGRVGGRAIGRTLIELAAAPVFAIWNAVVCHKIMRQARVRALGRQLVNDAFTVAFPNGVSSLDEAVQMACFSALREKVVGAAEFHPNLVIFAQRFQEESSIGNAERDTSAELAVHVRELTREDQARMVELYAFLCALDGRCRRQEAQALLKLQEALALPATTQVLETYQRAVLRGEPLSEAAEGRLTFHS